MRAAHAAWLAGIVTLACTVEASETHDLDFVAEHLPEVAMDNRFLTLPLWYAGPPLDDHWSWQLQSSFAEIRSGTLSLNGLSAAVSARHALGSRWSILGLGFLDPLSFASEAEVRPLAPRFASSIPLELPADALFTNLRGDMTHAGVGVAGTYQPQESSYAITFGLLYDRLKLRAFRADYELLSGANAGSTGTMDYSAVYPSWVPFASVGWRLQRGDWLFAPHFTAGWPLPRHGWTGHIEGPGFSVSGATDEVGNGVHIPDAFAGFGLGVGYVPWRLSLDVGSLANQALGEPFIHDGVDRAWLLSVSWDLTPRSSSVDTSD